MPDVTDLEALLQRARQGDGEALGQLMESYRASLRRLAQRQLGGRLQVRVDASDVVQQAFLEAHRSFDQFQGEGQSQLAAWLERILDNTVARTIRNHTLLQKRDVRREQSLDDTGGQGKAPAQELSAGSSTPSQKAVRREETERLARALESLPEDQRQAVRLRYLQGLSLQEIAQQMGRTEAAAAGLLKRGMQALRQHLRQSGEKGAP